MYVSNYYYQYNTPGEEDPALAIKISGTPNLSTASFIALLLSRKNKELEEKGGK